MKTLIAVAATLTASVLPTFASADHWHDRHHRIHDSGDGWRDLAILGGVAGIAGVATHNSTLTVIGAAGAVYSGLRYEQDRSHDHGWGWRGDDHRDWDRHHAYDRHSDHRGW